MGTLIIVLASALAVIAAYVGVSAYIASVAVRARRLPLLFDPGLPHENVTFQSRLDGLLLRGWYFAAGLECIVIVNGGEQNRVDPVTDTLGLAADLVGAGYSVLLFDLRGRGESEGQASLLPNNDRDVAGAVDFMRERGHEQVYIMGFSSGGAAALHFAAGDPVAAVVSDSCFASVSGMFVRVLARRGCPHIMARALAWGASLMGRVVHGLEKMDPEAIVGRVGCPLFFIHGGMDSGVPVEDAYRLFRAVPNPVSFLWVVPGAEHTQSFRTARDEYVGRVTGFLAGVSRSSQQGAV